jgi:multidrug efflux pump subunit AcrA (membrane-fusion protein)
MSRIRISFNRPTTWLCSGLIVTMALGCQQDSLNLSDSVSPTNSTVPTVATQTIQPTENAFETVSYFGRLVPAQQADLSFTVSGIVATVNAEPGQSVLAGDVLATFDQTDLETRRAAIVQQQQADESSRLRLQPSLEQLDAQAEQRTLVAPFVGVITQQHISVGSLASPQRPAFQMVSLATPLIEVDIPAKVARRISIGQTFWTQIEEQPFRATLKRKQPNISRAGLTGLTFAFNQESFEQLDAEALSLGQTVEIQFMLETDNSGFWLPLSSIQQQGGGLWSVLIAKPIVAQTNASATGTNLFVTDSRTVQVVQFDDDRALVAGQLKSGDRVITKGAFRIVAGQKVKIDAAPQSQPVTRDPAPTGETPESNPADPLTTPATTGPTNTDPNPALRGPKP